MQVKPVGWFEIYVNDIERARAFYEGVFALMLEKLEGPDADWQMWAFPGAMDQSNGASGALVHMPGAPVGGSGTIVYFMSADCAVEAGRAVAHGGTVDKDKFSLGEYGFAALLTDTEGNTIGVHSME
ncbi:VOC family protein [Lysobacter sp. Root690]|uniref:VOC family protein n=1 Tax=Lysobacter sp. Root690 TaxID=1736588 RepID=UPI0006F60857|nr:VOC family protein [Lysobacter sp. Root690]KRB08586.1 lactoylglutathione lyase [Lysobacter sp. Root690]